MGTVPVRFSLQIWALGDAVAMACDVVSRLAEKGCRVGVVNARFVKPLDTALLQRHLAAGVQLVTIENAALAGGFGATVAETVAAWPGRTLPLMRFGWPDEFIAHGPVDVLAREQGLAADQIAERIFSSVSRQ